MGGGAHALRVSVGVEGQIGDREALAIWRVLSAKLI